MLEIKYRGKRIDTGEWVYGYYGFDSYSHTHYISVITTETELNQVNYPVEDKTVGQFTGRTDKSGKEIYQGDIVSSNMYKDKKWTVEYTTDSEYCGFVLREVGKDSLSFFVSWEWIEVIGNKFENPELCSK